MYTVKKMNEKDIPICKKNVSEKVYPKGWDYVSVTADKKDFLGLVLFYNKNIVGYATLDVAIRDVLDLAVLPNHQKKGGSKVLITHLFRVMYDLGGVWTADARESTALQTLRNARDKGLIKLKEGGVRFVMDGEKLIMVKIKVLVRP